MLGSSRRVADRCYGKFATCYAGNPRCYADFWDCYKLEAPKIASATSSTPTSIFTRRLSLCYRPEFENAAKGRSITGYAFCGHKTRYPPQPRSIGRVGMELARSCLRPVDDGGPRSRRRESECVNGSSN